MARSRLTPGEMFPVIEAYFESGLTQRAFCSERGLSQAVFNYWLARYRRKQGGGAGAFVEITPNRPPPPADGAVVEIAYPGGIRLRILSPVGPGYLKQLLTA